MKIKEVLIAIKTPLTLLLVLTGFIILLIFMFPTQEQTQEPKDAPNDFFVCCVEKLSSEYYTVVYATKEGDCHYPHFTHIRQVQAFIDYLETLGTVNRNGYEVVE